MPEPIPYSITGIDWPPTKRKINGAIRKAKSIQIFVMTDYFDRDLDKDTPRHKVTTQYALKFIEAVDDDKLPGLAKLDMEDLTYLLIPYSWKDRDDLI